ncbi:hypothetical protein CHS0354_017748 [Potamilus streckersoni]|uniref:Uncharacterized protein n=1 Tax=Potamilus streckersoni TaxID=2493646 RepID=A0AAE0S3C2_9BIVA|nr:hypothetical protein CHS0354_017748 [Potamilus streckersoni]
MENLFPFSWNNDSKYLCANIKRIFVINRACNGFAGTMAGMKLTRIVPVLVIASLTSVYSFGCNKERIQICAENYVAVMGSTEVTSPAYKQLLCSSNALQYLRCGLEETHKCDAMFSASAFTSVDQVEKTCGINGKTLSPTDCDILKLTQCQANYRDIIAGPSSQGYFERICRSDSLSNLRCMFEETSKCSSTGHDYSSIGYSSINQVQQLCGTNNGQTNSKHKAVIIMGLFMVFLSQIFPR